MLPERIEAVFAICVGVVCFVIGLRAILRGTITVWRGHYRVTLVGTPALIYAVTLTFFGLVVFVGSVTNVLELTELEFILTRIFWIGAVAFTIVHISVLFYD